MKTRAINYIQITRVVGTAFLCAALALSLVWPTPSRAQTYSVSELQALLNQILAQLNAVQPGSSPAGVCPYVWTRSLGQGSTGADVLRLQQFLNASADTRLAVSGAGSPGMETQYYGPITAAAVSKFQVKYRSQVLTPLGLVNPTGYFGPASTAQANQLCVTGGTTTPPTTPGDQTLRGGAGSLTDVRLMGSISNEDVGEGQSDVEVLGLEVRAEGSDVEISAVVIDFDQISHTGNLNRYARNVSLWLDGERYATIDADQFTRSNNYRRTVTLDRNAIIRQGDIGELVVSVSGASTIDSSRVDDRWTVGIDSIRFRDAQNAVITDTQSDGLERTITFREFAASVGLGINIRGGDSSINQARTIEVSATQRTRNVPVLSFRVQVDGDSDVVVDTMTFNATTTGGTLNQIATAAYLNQGNNRVGSQSITSSAGSITFNDLNLELRGGQTYDFTVQLDLNAANGTNYSSGATIDVDLTTDNRNNWYIEDENGDIVRTTDRRGTASADAHTLRTSGVSLNQVSVTTREVYSSNNPSVSYGEFRMMIEVTAIGGPAYIPETATRSATSSALVGATYRFEDASGNIYNDGTASESFTRVSGGVLESGFVRIDEGQTARFELVTTLDPDAFNQYRAQLISIGFNDTAASPDSVVTANPTSNYRTGLQVISN